MEEVKKNQETFTLSSQTKKSHDIQHANQATLDLFSFDGVRLGGFLRVWVSCRLFCRLPRRFLETCMIVVVSEEVLEVLLQVLAVLQDVLEGP